MAVAWKVHRLYFHPRLLFLIRDFFFIRDCFYHPPLIFHPLLFFFFIRGSFFIRDFFFHPRLFSSQLKKKKSQVVDDKKKSTSLPGHLSNVSIQVLESIRKYDIYISLCCESIRETGPTVQISVLRVAWKIEI